MKMYDRRSCTAGTATRTADDIEAIGDRHSAMYARPPARPPAPAHSRCSPGLSPCDRASGIRIDQARPSCLDIVIVRHRTYRRGRRVLIRSSSLMFDLHDGHADAGHVRPFELASGRMYRRSSRLSLPCHVRLRLARCSMPLYRSSSVIGQAQVVRQLANKVRPTNSTTITTVIGQYQHYHCHNKR